MWLLQLLQAPMEKISLQVTVALVIVLMHFSLCLLALHAGPAPCPLPLPTALGCGVMLITSDDGREQDIEGDDILATFGVLMQFVS